jgi:hypothetical protein
MGEEIPGTQGMELREQGAEAQNEEGVQEMGVKKVRHSKATLKIRSLLDRDSTFPQNLLTYKELCAMMMELAIPLANLEVKNINEEVMEFRRRYLKLRTEMQKYHDYINGVVRNEVENKVKIKREASLNKPDDLNID